MIEEKTERDSNNEVLSQRHKPKVYKFSEFQVEAAKCRALGYSLSQIAKNLKERFGLPKEPNTNQISQTLTAFKRTDKYLRQAVLELSKVGYWEKQVNHRPASIRALEKEKQMLREGYWPFNRVPYGYEKDENGKLKIDLEKAKIVKEIFGIAAQGKSPLQFGLQVRGGSPAKIYKMISNPIYKGCQRFGDETLQLPHAVILDEKTWEEAQKVHVGRRGPPPFGYKWSGLRLVPIPEEREIVQKIFSLRLEKKSMMQIKDELKDELTKLERRFPWETIRRPLYKTKQWMAMGKIVEVEGDPFIPATVWDRAQHIRVSKSDWAEKRREQTRNDIVEYLRKWQFATTKQIAEATKISHSLAGNILRMLKFKGLVDRKLHGRRWLWFLSNEAKDETSLHAIWVELTTMGKPEYLKSIVDQLPAKTAEIYKKTSIRKAATVMVWLRRLERRGVVEQHPSNRWGTWHLTPEWAKFLGKEESPYDRLWSEILAIRRREDCIKVLQFLLDRPATSGELSKTLGLRQNTIGKWLKRLEDNGLATKHPPHIFGKWHLKSEFAEFMKQKLNEGS